MVGFINISLCVVVVLSASVQSGIPRIILGSKEVAMSIIGYPLGILIGVITGYVFILFFQTAIASSKVKYSTVMKVSTQLLAMPTFWFGGPWVTTQFLQSVNFAALLPGYLVSLTLTFLLLVSWPLSRFVISVGNQVGKVQRRKK